MAWREYIANMRAVRIFVVNVVLLVVNVMPAHAQMAIGSVGGAFVPAGGTSSLSSGPVTLPGQGPGVVAAPAGGSPTLTPSGAMLLPPPAAAPHPSGRVTVALPLVESPYLPQPKLNPCLAAYVSSSCGSSPPATATYPSGRIK